jgi:hypothetical protein
LWFDDLEIASGYLNGFFSCELRFPVSLSLVPTVNLDRKVNCRLLNDTEYFYIDDLINSGNWVYSGRGFQEDCGTVLSVALIEFWTSVRHWFCHSVS